MRANGDPDLIEDVIRVDEKMVKDIHKATDEGPLPGSASYSVKPWTRASATS